ncbi:hypothetical protein D9M69_631440 [compost metagenome]
MDRPGIHRLIHQGRPEFSGPVHYFLFIDLQQEVELFFKEGLVIFEIIPEKRERLNKASSSHPYLRPSA